MRSICELNTIKIFIAHIQPFFFFFFFNFNEGTSCKNQYLLLKKTDTLLENLLNHNKVHYNFHSKIFVKKTIIVENIQSGGILSVRNLFLFFLPCNVQAFKFD